MTRYIIRRLLQAIPLFAIISIILFVMMKNVGDPLATLGGRKATRSEDRARLTCQLGLDQPVMLQYVYWLIGNDWTPARDCNNDGVAEIQGRRQGVLRGDWGVSIQGNKSTIDIILDKLPNTLLLMVTSEVIIVVGAMVIGIYSALRQYTFVDNLVTTLSFFGFSMPIFFVALAGMFIFGVTFRRLGLPYLPTTLMFDPRVGETVPQVLWHLILPVISISVISFAAYSRYIRSTMLEVMNQDYIRTARSKGLPRRDIVMIHALKNASLPIVTIVGLDLPLLLGGAVVTEGIFSWPGMGSAFLLYVGKGDVAPVMGILMMITVAVVVFQILTDMVYAWLDPRIRLE
jgi:peptide/nickel transport system permease protein